MVSPGTPVSSTTKTGRHDIAEILLKVALKTKNQAINQLIENISRTCTALCPIRLNVFQQQKKNTVIMRDVRLLDDNAIYLSDMQLMNGLHKPQLN